MSKRSNHAGVYSISLCALLLSMMLIVGYVESMIPLNVGIPGIKLGMSNSVLIFAVYMLDIPTAFMLMSLKVLLSGILFAGPTTMMYGFAGGVLSLLCMALLSRIKGLSIPVVSIVGGVMHNVGQIGMSLLVLQVPPMSMLGYLGVLMCVGAVCGLLTGVCAKSVMAHLKHLSCRRCQAWAEQAWRLDCGVGAADCHRPGMLESRRSGRDRAADVTIVSVCPRWDGCRRCPDEIVFATA